MKQRRRFCKSEARRLLGQQNLFALILALLAMVMLTVAWQIIADGFFAFFDFGEYAPEPPTETVLEAARTAVTAFGWFVLIMPLWYGLRAIGMTAVTGQGVAEPGQIFAAFASPRTLLRVWRASLWMVWRAALAGGLVWGMWSGVGLLETLVHPIAYFFLCAGAVVLTPILLLPLAGTQLIYPLLLADRSLGVFAAVRLATKMAFRSFWETLLFWCTFLPWFALGLCTGGVMLILYVLPYFILADTVYVLCRMGGWPITQITKEINHV